MLGQALAGVVGHGLHQLLVDSALRTNQMHRPATDLPQPLGDGFLILRHVLDNYPGRHHEGRRLVELLDELPQHQFLGVVLSTLHEEVVPADQLALPDEEHFYPGFVAALGQSDHVHVADGVGVDLDPLLFGHLVDGLDPVPEDRGAFELQVLRCLVHVGSEVVGDGPGIAVHEHDHLADDLGVVLFAGDTGAGGHTAVDVILEARTSVVAGDPLGAGSVREKSFDQVHGLAHGAGSGERTEVPGPVFVVHTPGDVDPGEFLVQVNLEVGIGLVVFQPGVVAGFVPLD